MNEGCPTGNICTRFMPEAPGAKACGRSRDHLDPRLSPAQLCREALQNMVASHAEASAWQQLELGLATNDSQEREEYFVAARKQFALLTEHQSIQVRTRAAMAQVHLPVFYRQAAMGPAAIGKEELHGIYFGCAQIVGDVLDQMGDDIPKQHPGWGLLGEILPDALLARPGDPDYKPAVASHRQDGMGWRLLHHDLGVLVKDGINVPMQAKLFHGYHCMNTLRHERLGIMTLRVGSFIDKYVRSFGNQYTSSTGMPPPIGRGDNVLEIARLIAHEPAGFYPSDRFQGQLLAYLSNRLMKQVEIFSRKLVDAAGNPLPLPSYHEVEQGPLGPIRDAVAFIDYARSICTESSAMRGIMKNNRALTLSAGVQPHFNQVDIVIEDVAEEQARAVVVPALHTAQLDTMSVKTPEHVRYTIYLRQRDKAEPEAVFTCTLIDGRTTLSHSLPLQLSSFVFRRLVKKLAALASRIAWAPADEQRS